MSYNELSEVRMKPELLRMDPWLEPHAHAISGRLDAIEATKKRLKKDGSLSEFANGHLYFGCHYEQDKLVFRTWAPHATTLYLVGDFNAWKSEIDYQFERLENDVFELKLQADQLPPGTLYRYRIQWPGGEGERIPAWCRRVIQRESDQEFFAEIEQAQEYKWENEKHGEWEESAAPIIYEAHVGMASEAGEVGSFKAFTEERLQYIADLGYNTIQFMAIQEHPYYGSFGYHVSSLFAPSSRFGTAPELKAMVDRAHSLGLRVIMDIVHSHVVKNEIEGLSRYDGSYSQWFHDGPRGMHHAWDSRCFDYGKPEVLHFLLSNLKYWLEEFRFDGFRFDGVTSMLYLDHGLERDFVNYDDYYNGNQDQDAITYLALANDLIHEIKPKALSVAEEMSGMPGLALEREKGGIGFDRRLAMGIPDHWIKWLKEKPDEEWLVSEIYQTLVSRRVEEKTISYAESHDQALVGDKTIAFRLMDKEMYTHMHREQQSHIIDRGIALHKLIRLITLTTAGAGYLNFMGNEFGHPEWIDFPREGNKWSYHYARRQWSLLENEELRYVDLLEWDRSILQLIKSHRENFWNQDFPYLKHEHNDDKVLAFERGGLAFVFNFHPEKSFTDYPIAFSQANYRLLFSSDDKRYGGFERLVADSQHRRVNGKQYFYLPSRTCAVFQPQT